MEGSIGWWRIFNRPGFKLPEKAVLTQLEDVNPVRFERAYSEAYGNTTEDPPGRVEHPRC